MSKKHSGMLIMVLCTLFWSIGGLFIKLVPWNGMVVSGFRSLIAAVFFAGYLRVRRIPVRLNRRSLLVSVMLASTCMAFVCANKLTSSINAIVLQQCSPVIVLLYSVLIQKKRMLTADYLVVALTAAGILVCLLLVSLILTVVKTNDTRQVELSAPENYTVDQDAGVIRIPTEAVNDGHLHRFEYKTEKNINVRWIVVKKPNSASFGVGLDACEICGKTGYYEKSGGQVVCNKCDVIMNINAIGLVKDGCYPIPVAYEIQDGMLVISTEELESHEKRFK